MTEKKTIQIQKSHLMNTLVIILAVLLIVSIFTGGFQFKKENTKVGDEAPDEAPSINMKALIDDDAMQGNPDATVTIVEFSDYECPFCARFYSQTYDQIIEQYVDTGKVNLVFRDFPLSFHPNAQKAAEAAECAGEQGKYYEMHDKIFDNQQALSVTGYKQWASEIGLDTAKFNSCLDSGQMASEVQKDFQDGQAAGVRGTPAFLVNGKLISGAQPFQVFEQVIEAELAS